MDSTLGVTGDVTANSYYGDGSNLDGVSGAGDVKYASTGTFTGENTFEGGVIISSTTQILAQANSHSVDTVYQALTDTIVVGNIGDIPLSNGDACYIRGYIGATNTPTTLIASAGMTAWTATFVRVYTNSLTMPVPKDMYWKIVSGCYSGSATITINAFPFGNNY